MEICLLRESSLMFFVHFVVVEKSSFYPKMEILGGFDNEINGLYRTFAKFHIFIWIKYKQTNRAQ